MFYDKYEFLCRAKGISLSKAADEIGFDRSSITKWKNKGFTPRQELLVKIADYFSVTVDYLLLNEQNKKPPTSNTETWTVYNFEGEGTHTTTLKTDNIDKLSKLLKTAGELSTEQIEALIKVAENMK